ncbi:MAG TPA: hypothetical protein VKK31_31685 [Thermoanaerobaculia bacterium]|nr:hypothetical protein [Thermoanaerobaculia bacterium]
MSYKDYTDGVWEVQTAEKDSKCPAKHIVTFTGPETQVILHCNEETPYSDGEYKSASDTIESMEYVIRMMKGGPKPQIEFALRSSAVAASWTAEDQASWREPEDG